MDHIDIEIIELLQENPRRTNADIARWIGTSEPTVRKHIDGLVDSGVLKIVAVLNPEKLGYRGDFTILIKISPGHVDTVVQQLRKHDEIIYIGIITGHFDVIIEVLLRDEDRLHAFISQALGKIPGIRSTESSTILKIDKINYEWKLPPGFIERLLPDTPLKCTLRKAVAGENPVGTTNDSPPLALDAIDYRVINLLQENGRRTNADIARTVKTSEPTVKNRIQRMIRHDYLKIVATLDPRSIGYGKILDIGIKVSPGQLKSVGQRLKAMDEVVFLEYQSGRFDILIEVFLTDSAALFRFVTETLSNLVGIQSMERFHVLHIERTNYEWKLPADHCGGATMATEI